MRWVDRYYEEGYESWVQYHLEENGRQHLNNMLPNGEIREDLEKAD